MDVRELIYSALKGEGCTMHDEAGILIVETPDGEKWDMTIPFSEHEQAILRNPKPEERTTKNIHEDADACTIPHLNHVDCLEVVCYEDKGVITNVTVECAKCGHQVKEIYTKDQKDSGIRDPTTSQDVN